MNRVDEAKTCLIHALEALTPSPLVRPEEALLWTVLAVMHLTSIGEVVSEQMLTLWKKVSVEAKP
jgi:hypothetical protein